MKISVLLISVLLCSVGLLMPAQATENKASVSNDDMAAADKKGPVKPHHGGGTSKTATYKGEVNSVDESAKTFAVRGKGGDESFTFDDKTVVSPKGATFSVGDSVTVSYRTDGETKTATKITLHKAKMMKKGM